MLILSSYFATREVFTHIRMCAVLLIITCTCTVYSTCVICVVCGDNGVVRTYGPIVLLCVVFG